MNPPPSPPLLLDYFLTIGLSSNSPIFPLKKPGEEEFLLDFLIFQGNHEEIPLEYQKYEKLEYGFYGVSGNINSQRLFGDSLWLGLLKGRATGKKSGDGPAPIVDILIINQEKGEKIPPGYEPVPVIDSSGSSSSSSELGNSRFFVLRASEGPTISMSRLVDLTIALDSDRERFPHHCRSLPLKSLRSPLTGDYPLLLFYYETGGNSFQKSYKPMILERFPRENIENTPFPDSIPFYCFPTGISLKLAENKPPVENFSFLITTVDGQESYCSAIIFYEEISIVGNSSSTASSNDSSRIPLIFPPGTEIPSISPHLHIYSPKSLVLVSKFPYYSQFSLFLNEFYRRACEKPALEKSSNFLSLSPNGNIPLERILGNLWEIPIPRSNSLLIQWNFPSSTSPIKSLQFPYIPSEYSFPSVDYEFPLFFRLLSLSNIFSLFSAILNERKILFLSPRKDYLLPIMETIRHLLFPFQWKYAFIPILPDSTGNLGIFDAPMPICVGIAGDFILPGRFYKDEEFFIVDLYRDSIKWYGMEKEKRVSHTFSKKSLELLPESLTNQLKRDLEPMTNIFSPGNPSSSSSTGISPSLDSLILLTRSAFLHVFLSMFHSLEEFLLFPPLNPGNSLENPSSSSSSPSSPPVRERISLETLLDKEKFLSSCSKSSKSFLKSFLNTQMFMSFLEENLYPTGRKREIQFYRYCCEYYRLSLNNPSSSSSSLSSSSSSSSLSSATSSSASTSSIGLEKEKFSTSSGQNQNLYEKYRLNIGNCQVLYQFLTQQRQSRPPPGLFIVPGPNFSGISVDSRYSYPHWPIPWNISLFSPPRPIVLSYYRELWNFMGLPIDFSIPSHHSIGNSTGKRRVSQGNTGNSSSGAPGTAVSPPGNYPLSDILKGCKGIFLSFYGIWFSYQCAQFSSFLPSSSSSSSSSSSFLLILETLQQLTSKYLLPDSSIYSSVLKICGLQGKFQEAEFLMETMKRNNIPITGELYAAFMEGEIQALAAASASAVDSNNKGKSLLWLNSLGFSDDFHHRSASALRKLRQRVFSYSRQRILWNSCFLGLGVRCQKCGFECLEAELLASTIENSLENGKSTGPQKPSAAAPPVGNQKNSSNIPIESIKCISCHEWLVPLLFIRVSIEISPPRWKSWVFSHIFHRPLGNSPVKKYLIAVNYLSPHLLRKRISSLLQEFPEHFSFPYYFRAFHEELYWNLLYSWTAPVIRPLEMEFLTGNRATAGGEAEKNNTTAAAVGEGASGKEVSDGGFSIKRFNVFAPDFEGDMAEMSGGGEQRKSSKARHSISSSVLSLYDSGPISPTRAYSESYADSSSDDENSVTSPTIGRSQSLNYSKSSNPSNNKKTPRMFRPIVRHKILSSQQPPSPAPPIPADVQAKDKLAEQEISSLIQQKSWARAVEFFLDQRIAMKAEEMYKTQEDSRDKEARMATPEKNSSQPLGPPVRITMGNSLSPETPPSHGDFSPLPLTPQSNSSPPPRPIPNSIVKKNHARQPSEAPTLSESGESLGPRLVTSPESGNSSRPSSSLSQSADSIHISRPWFPSRSTKVRPWKRCLFEYFWSLASPQRLVDYSSLIEIFQTLVFPSLSLHYLDEISPMDRPPSKIVQTVEMFFKLKAGVNRKAAGSDKAAVENAAIQANSFTADPRASQNSELTRTGSSNSLRLPVAHPVGRLSSALSPPPSVSSAQRDNSPSASAAGSSKSLGWNARPAAVQPLTAAPSIFDGPVAPPQPVSSGKRVVAKPTSGQTFGEKLAFFLLSTPVQNHPKPKQNTQGQGNVRSPPQASNKPGQPVKAPGNASAAPPARVRPVQPEKKPS